MASNTEHHHPSLGVYFAVFFALLVLTAVTVQVAFIDFGVLNTPIALGIAGFKATLVVLFFMHVKYGSRLTQLFAVSGFLWLAIMFAFMAGDYMTRHWEIVRGWTSTLIGY